MLFLLVGQCGKGPQGKAVPLSRLQWTEMTLSLSQSRSFSSGFVLTGLLSLVLNRLCAVFMYSTCLSAYRFTRGTSGNQFPSYQMQRTAMTHVASSLLICFTKPQQIGGGGHYSLNVRRRQRPVISPPSRPQMTVRMLRARRALLQGAGPVNQQGCLIMSP